MRTLLDTNILTRTAEVHHPMYQAAIDAVAVLRAQGGAVVIVPQNLYEFWVVCTRPTVQNGLGLSATQAAAELARLKSMCLFIPDTPAVFPQWEQLVAHHQVLGKNAHDARLVAAMLVHGIDRILTFNAGDFLRFPGTLVLTPQQVLAPPPPTP